MYTLDRLMMKVLFDGHTFASRGQLNCAVIQITCITKQAQGATNISNLTLQSLPICWTAVWVSAFIAMPENLANGLRSLSKLLRKKSKSFSFRWR